MDATVPSCPPRSSSLMRRIVSWVRWLLFLTGRGVFRSSFAFSFARWCPSVAMVFHWRQALASAQVRSNGFSPSPHPSVSPYGCLCAMVYSCSLWPVVCGGLNSHCCRGRLSRCQKPLACCRLAVETRCGCASCWAPTAPSSSGPSAPTSPHRNFRYLSILWRLICLDCDRRF